MITTPRRTAFTICAAVLLLVVSLGASPAASAFPPGVVASASINATTFKPGDAVVVSARNVTPGGTLTMLIYSAPVVLGTGVVDQNGSGVVTGAVPAGYSGSHTIVVNASSGESFAFSITVLGGPPDTVPPAAVSGLAGTTTGTTATLTWTNPPDSDVTGVVVFRSTGTTPPAYGGTPVGTAGPGATTFTDSQLAGLTTYSWSVFARDASGNVSPGASVTLTTTRATPSLTWTAPSLIDGFSGTPSSMSCVSATWCVGGDSEGNVYRWNGTTWGPREHLFQDPQFSNTVAVSCVSASWCLAVPDYGRAQVLRGAAWGEVGDFLPNGDKSVSCLATTSCVMVVGTSWSVFDGTTWSARFDSGGASSLRQLSCASASRCVALDGDGAVWSYSGTKVRRVDPAGEQYTALSCVRRTTSCVAVTRSGTSRVLTGTTWSAATTVPAAGVDAVSCPTTTFCAAASGGVVLAVWDGSAWRSSEPGSPPSAFDGFVPRAAVSCVGAVFCGGAGGGWLRTFTGTGLTYGTGLRIPLHGGPNSVSCAPDRSCLMVDLLGAHATRAAGAADWAVSEGITPGYPTVSCVAATWCLRVVNGAADVWDGGTFVPLQAAGTPPFQGVFPVGVSCSSRTFCVVVASGGRAEVWNGTRWRHDTVPGAGDFQAVSCRSTTCAATDSTGAAFVLRSGAWSAPSRLGTSLPAVSCGSTTWCLAADDGGATWAWDGTRWSATAGPAGMPGTPGLSCTGVRACTMVAGGAVARLGAYGWSATTRIGPDGGMPALSCATSTQCVVTYRSGEVVTAG